MEWRILFVLSLYLLKTFAEPEPKPGQNPGYGAPNPLIQQLTAQSQITPLGANSYYVIRPQHLMPGSFSAQQPHILSALQASMPQQLPQSAPRPNPTAASAPGPVQPTHFQLAIPQNAVPLTYRAIPLGTMPVHSSFVPLTTPLNVVKYVLVRGQSQQVESSTPSPSTTEAPQGKGYDNDDENDEIDRDEEEELNQDGDRDDYDELSPSDIDETVASPDAGNSAVTNNNAEDEEQNGQAQTQTDKLPSRNRGNGRTSSRNNNRAQAQPVNSRRTKNRSRRPSPNTLFNEDQEDLDDIRELKDSNQNQQQGGRQRNSASRENTRGNGNSSGRRKNNSSERGSSNSREQQSDRTQYGPPKKSSSRERTGSSSSGSSSSGSSSRERNNSRGRNGSSSRERNGSSSRDRNGSGSNRKQQRQNNNQRNNSNNNTISTVSTRRPIYFTTNVPWVGIDGSGSNSNIQQQQQNVQYPNSINSSPLQVLPPRDLQQQNVNNNNNNNNNNINNNGINNQGITIRQSSQQGPNSLFGPTDGNVNVNLNGGGNGVSQDIEYRVIPSLRYEVAGNGNTVIPSADDSSPQIQNQGNSGGYLGGQSQNGGVSSNNPSSQYGIPQNQNQNRPNNAQSSNQGYQINQGNVQQIPPRTLVEYGPPQSTNQNNNGGYQINQVNVQQVKPNSPNIQYGQPQNSNNDNNNNNNNNGGFQVSPGNEHNLIQLSPDYGSPANQNQNQQNQYESPSLSSSAYGAPFIPGKPLTTYGPPSSGSGNGNGNNGIGNGYTLQSISLGNQGGSNLNDVLSLVRQFATSQVTGKNSVNLGNGRQSQFSITPSNTNTYSASSIQNQQASPSSAYQAFRGINSSPSQQTYNIKTIPISHPGYGAPAQQLTSASTPADFRTSITVAYGNGAPQLSTSSPSHGGHPQALFQTIENALRKQQQGY